MDDGPGKQEGGAARQQSLLVARILKALCPRKYRVWLFQNPDHKEMMRVSSDRRVLLYCPYICYAKTKSINQSKLSVS